MSSVTRRVDSHEHASTVLNREQSRPAEEQTTHKSMVRRHEVRAKNLRFAGSRASSVKI
jgi:hypothetical protein